MSSINIWQLLVIAVIVVLLFGTKKLSAISSDLGESIKSFKKAINDSEENVQTKPSQSANPITTESVADESIRINENIEHSDKK